MTCVQTPIGADFYGSSHTSEGDAGRFFSLTHCWSVHAFRFGVAGASRVVSRRCWSWLKWIACDTRARSTKQQHCQHTVRGGLHEQLGTTRMNALLLHTLLISHAPAPAKVYVQREKEGILVVVVVVAGLCCGGIAV